MPQGAYEIQKAKRDKDDALLLYEDGQWYRYSQEELQLLLERERTSEPPPGSCNPKFYRRRSRNVTLIEQVLTK